MRIILKLLSGISLLVSVASFITLSFVKGWIFNWAARFQPSLQREGYTVISSSITVKGFPLHGVLITITVVFAVIAVILWFLPRRNTAHNTEHTDTLRSA